MCIEVFNLYLIKIDFWKSFQSTLQTGHMCGYSLEVKSNTYNWHKWSQIDKCMLEGLLLPPVNWSPYGAWGPICVSLIFWLCNFIDFHYAIMTPEMEWGIWPYIWWLRSMLYVVLRGKKCTKDQMPKCCHNTCASWALSQLDLSSPTVCYVLASYIYFIKRAA